MGIIVLQWNCRSILNKLSWFQCLTFSIADILALLETFINTDESLTIPGKVIHRLDRLGRPSGGLVITINPAWSSLQINFDSNNLSNKPLGIRVFPDPTPLNIINIYLSSGLVVDGLTKVSNGLSGATLIVGDFNLHPVMFLGILA